MYEKYVIIVGSFIEIGDIKLKCKVGKTKRVAFCTLGCKVNQYETNAMMQKFMENGYEVVEFEKEAEVYVVNTCTVTNIADKKSRQMLRKVKEINKEAVLVAVRLLCSGGKAGIGKNTRNRFDFRH